MNRTESNQPDGFDLRAIQKPIKQAYRSEPGKAVITMSASGDQAGTPTTCSVDIGRAVYEAQAHACVGGTGTAACSGDLLLGALAACARCPADAPGPTKIEGNWVR